MSSNTLVVLEVPDESSLTALVDRAVAKGLAVATFREPDLGDSLTAAAFDPRAKGLLRRARLACST